MTLSPQQNGRPSGGAAIIRMAAPVRIYEAYRSAHDAITARVLASGVYIAGPDVDEFTEAFAAYHSRPISPTDPRHTHTTIHAATCANGTDALLLAYRALGLHAGDEIIIPTHNYIAAAESAVSLGLVPVWADVAEEGFQIDPDPDYLASLLSPRTKAIVAVNLYGTPAPLSDLLCFCRAHDLFLIEDNAQGTGGAFRDEHGTLRPLGSAGDISVTSFFPTKPLGCIGDGGAVLSCNQSLIEHVRMLASHGQADKYDYQSVGMNSRLDALQAAILNFRLSLLDEFICRQTAIAEKYTATIRAKVPGVICPTLKPGDSRPAWHQYTLLVEERDRDPLRKTLVKAGIASLLYYPQPLHKIKTYQPLSRMASGGYPRAERLSRSMLSLPVHPYLHREETDHILNTLSSYYG